MHAESAATGGEGKPARAAESRHVRASCGACRQMGWSGSSSPVDVTAAGSDS